MRIRRIKREVDLLQRLKPMSKVRYECAAEAVLPPEELRGLTKCAASPSASLEEALGARRGSAEEIRESPTGAKDGIVGYPARSC